MAQYKDSLGYIYNVPESCVPAFERRRRTLLMIAIVGQLVMLVGVLYFAWFIAPGLP